MIDYDFESLGTIPHYNRDAEKLRLIAEDVVGYDWTGSEGAMAAMNRLRLILSTMTNGER